MRNLYQSFTFSFTAAFTLARYTMGSKGKEVSCFELYSGNKGIAKSRRRMGAVVETPAIYLGMTAEENLRQQYQILGRPSYNRIAELLSLVGLSDTGNKKAKNFSLGMRQRLGIAVAL